MEERDLYGRFLVGHKHSEETIKKIKEAISGDKNVHLGTHWSKERIEIMRNINLGRKMTIEDRIKMSNRAKESFKNGRIHPRLGIKLDEYHNKLLIEARKKRITPIKDTSIEVKIQKYLKQLGLVFFTHQYIKEIEHGYQCDILIPSMNLVIECDGDYWHSYPTGREIDHIRTSELIEKGFKVLRLWECEIKKMSFEEFKNKIA